MVLESLWARSPFSTARQIPAKWPTILRSRIRKRQSGLKTPIEPPPPLLPFPRSRAARLHSSVKCDPTAVERTSQEGEGELCRIDVGSSSQMVETPLIYTHIGNTTTVAINGSSDNCRLTLPPCGTPITLPRTTQHLYDIDQVQPCQSSRSYI